MLGLIFFDFSGSLEDSVQGVVSDFGAAGVSEGLLQGVGD